MTNAYEVESGDARLDCLVWTPARSNTRGEGVVFCHGWGGGAQYDDLLARLAEEGYVALRLSQRGYGKSTGRADLSRWAEDMAACAKSMRSAMDVHRIWAAGQSTGGTMSLVAAATEDVFAGAVAIAAFTDLTRILEDNRNARKILEDRFGPLEEKHFRAADAAAMVGNLKKPALIVHGTADETVPFAHGELLYDKMRPAATHRGVPGGNHHLNNVDRAAVIDDIMAWLKSH
ncbi:MAG TPA: alpha/beta fold hydrolase [Candidatus Binatia bacterium]|nr:alpha/beta fold hydrolase [Candidatus Binatia bacterium]